MVKCGVVFAVRTEFLNIFRQVSAFKDKTDYIFSKEAYSVLFLLNLVNCVPVSEGGKKIE
jgi:hypothetical protein